MWPNPQFPADLVTFTEEILNALRKKSKKRNHLISAYGLNTWAKYFVKSIRIWSFSDSHIPAFGLNTKIYSVNLLFSPNAGKYGPEILWIRTVFTQHSKPIQKNYGRSILWK